MEYVMQTSIETEYVMPRLLKQDMEWHAYWNRICIDTSIETEYANDTSIETEYAMTRL